ncbi:hypothetical protein PV325_007901 [Microctonus aethiopoides]|nr:hypothetical protein PV325_007901 [Microctonus aethiopoides]
MRPQGVGRVCSTSEDSAVHAIHWHRSWIDFPQLEAYRKWVCSSLVPYFAHEGPSTLTTTSSIVDTRLRPCRSFCQSVEQRCPYLLPGDRAPAYPTQYAGEPTFLCRDPNIPETGEQAKRSLHGNEEEECCFRVCSEDEPGLGVCANCTDRMPHGQRIGENPRTAPHHCDINTVPIQSVSSSDQQNTLDGSTETLSPAPPSTTSASSFCGSGGVGSMSSSSSKTSTAPAPVSLLCLLSIWTAIISLCTGQMIFPWSPAINTNFSLRRECTKTNIKMTTRRRQLLLSLSSSSSSLSSTSKLSSTLLITTTATTTTTAATATAAWSTLLLPSSLVLCKCSLTLVTTLKWAIRQLMRLLFVGWYKWWWRARKYINRSCGRILKWYWSKTRTKKEFRIGNDNGRYYSRVRWRCYCTTQWKSGRKRRKAQSANGDGGGGDVDGKERMARRRRRRFWLSPWKWKGPS